MPIDAEVKKTLDLRFARGEIGEAEHRAISLVLLAEPGGLREKWTLWS